MVAHLAAFAVPANRKLLRGMLHGKVNLGFVEERHCLWCDRLQSSHSAEVPVEVEEVADVGVAPMAMPPEGESAERAAAPPA